MNGLFALCLSLVFAACNGPEKEPETSEVETEEDLEIELSDKKVEVDVLDKVEVEIENFDDLSKVEDASESFDLTYTYSYPTLYLDGEGDVKECTVNEDGSFTLSLTAADLDNNPIFEGGLDMIFVPEK